METQQTMTEEQEQFHIAVKELIFHGNRSLEPGNANAFLKEWRIIGDTLRDFDFVIHPETVALIAQHPKLLRTALFGASVMVAISTIV